MDELWERYREFWIPVLIGVGAVLLGVIAVHIVSADPEARQLRANAKERALRGLHVPPNDSDSVRDRAADRILTEKRGRLAEDVSDWARRLDQAHGASDRLAAFTAQALGAAFLRGAPDSETADVARLAARFGGDEVAARQALRRTNDLIASHVQLLHTGDPNVAFSRLLSEVWGELSLRANRADMEIPDMLGFGSVRSVNRATLLGRVANLALVARLVDLSLRSGAQAVEAVGIEAAQTPSTPGDFIVEWPVSFAVRGPYGAMLHLADAITDPERPIAIVQGVTIEQPSDRKETGSGVVRLEAGLASVVVNADALLGLAQSERRGDGERGER